MCYLKKSIYLMVLASALLISNYTPVSSQSSDMGGWGLESGYNKLYKTSEMDSIRATVESVETMVPMPGMSPGVALMVRESENETITVHLCPVSFAKPDDIGIKKGDRVKIKGVWAEINGEDVFMASKVKKGDYFEFKVRLTSNGRPFWTMTPEELKNEKDQED